MRRPPRPVLRSLLEGRRGSRGEFKGCRVVKVEEDGDERRGLSVGERREKAVWSALRPLSASSMAEDEPRGEMLLLTTEYASHWAGALARATYAF